MTIEKDIKEIEQEITAIKVAQKTQNDSYSFYRYKSANLYQDDTYKTINLKFIPDKTDNQETICIFEACNGTGVQYDATPSTNPDDPLSAWTVMSTLPSSVGGVSLPSWCKFFYVYCITNKQGRLQVTIS